MKSNAGERLQFTTETQPNCPSITLHNFKLMIKEPCKWEPGFKISCNKSSDAGITRKTQKRWSNRARVKGTNAPKYDGQKFKWLQAKPDEEAQKEIIWTSEAA